MQVIKCSKSYLKHIDKIFSIEDYEKIDKGFKGKVFNFIKCISLNFLKDMFSQKKRYQRHSGI